MRTRFTEQELKETLAFYKSPIGKKVLAEEPVLRRPHHERSAGLGDQAERGSAAALPRRNAQARPRALIAERAVREPMSDFDVDLFVVGAGSGGVRAARIAAAYGARVMVAEEYRVGGTCVIRGCVPKKLLVYASRFADEFEDAAGYGWTVGEPVFDWATLIANKDREIDRLEAAYVANLERSGAKIVRSRAVLEDAHRVRLVEDRRGSAREACVDRDRRRAVSGRRVLPGSNM